MIKKPKKQSYKPVWSMFVYTVLFLSLYIFLPIYLTYLHCFSVKFLAALYLTNILAIFYFLKKNHTRIYQLQLKNQDLQEKINILNNQNSHELQNKAALQEKINRYNSLKKIIEKVNQDMNLESIADHLVSLAFSLIADNKGACLLYLLDKETQVTLSLFKTKKEDKKLIIKTKEGDIFDSWVLRHASPLFIEDIRKDFRFDLEKLKSEESRPISSLISSPLISEHRFLGMLRLDHPETNVYTQDDLRFLVTICDLGAVALENGELFKKTQDLAIHDELTLLYTRRYFLERLKEECKRSMRQGRAFSLLMLDIDYFKNYNDQFGHTAGDIVLKTLSQNIVETLKDLGPVISRFGGEEFCVVLPGIDKQKACNIAGELRAKIERTKIILRRQETNVTMSIGVATFPDDAKDEEELVFKADKLMYKAKQEGRNRVCGI